MNFSSEFRILKIYGGTRIQMQMDQLRRGVEIVVGTAGRIMDLIRRGNLDLRFLKTFILDETDEMLKQGGFKEDMDFILNEIRAQFGEKGRQMDDMQFLLFSATVPS